MIVRKKDLPYLIMVFFLLVVLSIISLTADKSISFVVCRLSVLLLFVFCIYRGVKEKVLLNPFILFSLTPFSLLIYVNISNSYMMDLSVHTWIIAIINMSAFLISFIYTKDYTHTHRCIGGGKETELVRHTIILLVLGLLPSLYVMLSGSIMPLASVFSLFSIAALACALKSKKKIMIMIVLIMLVFSIFIYFSKFTLLMIGFGLIVGYEKYYVKNRKQKKRLIIIAILGFLIMINAFTFAAKDRDAMSSDDSVTYYSKYGGVEWNGSNALFMPYMYMTTPWANLQYVTETQNTRTYGLWMVKPVINYFQLDELFSQQYALRSYSSFNTLTFIAVHYKDFGFWGSIISSCFLGFFVKKIYSRFLKSKSPFDCASYALVAQGVLMMFFSNEFFMQSFPFTIIIIMGIYKYVFCKKCEPELES